MIDSNKTARVRQLNDALRRSHTDGQITITAGVAAFDKRRQQRAVAAVAAFEAFYADNDPYDEHDFGVIELDGDRLMFKIDYYDLSLSAHSPDPTDATVTRRVLTLMLAEEY